MNITFALEIIGTIAFAISGAVVGLRYRTDIFGVLCLGIVTATGGGVIRDVILGNTPPSAFQNPIYVLTASIASVVIFAYAYYAEKSGRHVSLEFYKKLLFLMDSVGLGIFTVSGVHMAWVVSGGNNHFLCVFSGLITGVGGGLLRDMMVDQLPDIFRKHIYAIASIVGAMFTVHLYSHGYMVFAQPVGACVIIVIRLLAAHYKWNLPKAGEIHN